MIILLNTETLVKVYRKKALHRLSPEQRAAARRVANEAYDNPDTPLKTGQILERILNQLTD